MLTLRCSSTDRTLACGASTVAAEAEYNPNNPEAREGTAGHEAMILPVTGEGPTVDQVADKHGIDVEVLQGMVNRGIRAWDELKQWFPEPKCEVALEAQLSDSVMLRGHTDLLSIDGRAVEDWKFGWAPSTHTGQISSYAYLVREKHGMPECGYILGAEVWVRIGEVRLSKLRDEDLDRLQADLLSQVEQPAQYGPSTDSCRYCPRQLNCQAHTDWVQSGVTALAPVGEKLPVTRELIGELYDRSKQIGSALRRYDEVLKLMLMECPITLADGRVIALEEKEQDSIRVSRALVILREEMKITPSEEDLALKLTKSGLEKVMKGRAPERQGAAYMRKAMSRLREVGAVEKKIERQIKVTKP